MESQLNSEVARFKSPKESLGDFDAETAARVMAASSDIAIIIDRNGIIRDVAVSGGEIAPDAFSDLVERRWADTVTGESRHKVEEMLHEAHAAVHAARWREINQQTLRGPIPFRYIALDTGRDGKVIALGRDLRGVASMQQRLLQAQQSMERDYARLRQAESRYRLLFQISAEAVLIVDPVSKRVTEANPAAGALLGVDYEQIANQPFIRLFHPESRDSAAALVLDSQSGARQEPMRLRLADGRDEFAATASMFRQDGTVHMLVRIVSTRSETAAEAETKSTLLRVLNRIPDAFVVADDSLNIVDVNLAFLELSQLPSAESAQGQSLARFVGRAGVDMNVLMANLREHGWVRNFSSIVRTLYGAQDEVEISAVSVREGLEGFYGFVIRPQKRRVAQSSVAPRELPRTTEQLTELVGRVPLREIVRETTDVIERMCIEAALNLTSNNRASAAEVLGLSRQSLYSKLNRYDLGSSDSDGETEN
jgi:transcriptional regulator PpsR